MAIGLISLWLINLVCGLFMALEATWLAFGVILLVGGYDVFWSLYPDFDWVLWLQACVAVRCAVYQFSVLMSSYACYVQLKDSEAYSVSAYTAYFYSRLRCLLVVRLALICFGGFCAYVGPGLLYNYYNEGEHAYGLPLGLELTSMPTVIASVGVDISMPEVL